MSYQNKSFYIGGSFTTYILIFLSFYTFSLLTGCKKNTSKIDDLNIEHSDNCIPLQPCDQVTIGSGYEYIVDLQNFVTNPTFNPNNENEIVYLNQPTYDFWELYTFNLITKEKKLLLTGDIREPKWGKKNWIIFGKSDANIYKIKSNGDSLKQLTYSNNMHHPIWNYDGTKFLAFTEESNLFSLVFDLNGNILDTINFGQTNNSNFENPDYIVSNVYGKIYFFNINSNVIEYDYDYSDINSSGWGSIFWLNNNEVIYSNSAGLNKLTIPFLYNNNIKQSCNAKMYLWGDINNSMTKMIWSRGDYIQINECTLKYRSGIYIMDIDGENEKEIKLN